MGECKTEKQSLYFEEMDLLSKQIELLNQDSMVLYDRCDHFMKPDEPNAMVKGASAPEPKSSSCVDQIRAFQRRVNEIRDRINSMNQRIFQ